MEFSKFSLRKLIKLGFQLQKEVLKRIWWAAILIILAFIILCLTFLEYQNKIFFTTQQKQVSGNVVSELQSHVSQSSDYAKHKSGWINILSLGADNTGEKDCSEIIQIEIASYPEGKVVLYSPAGTYRVDTPIRMGLKTVLVGEGAEQTIFKAPNGNDLFDIDLTPPDNTTIISGATFKDIKLMGNFTSTTQRGIYVHNDKYSSVKYPSELRYGSFENIHISNCAYGILFTKKTGVYTLCDVLIDSCNQFGLYTEGSDAIHDRVRITSCENGIFANGGNCQWSNLKVFQNGICRNGKDYTTTYGALFKGSRNTFENCDFQENYYHGVVFQNAHNLILSVSADSNGYGKTVIHGADYGGSGVVFDGCYDVLGKISCDDYHTPPTQNYGLEVLDNNSNIRLEYVQHNQVNLFAGSKAASTSIISP